jgi:hypothetical protein
VIGQARTFPIAGAGCGIPPSTVAVAANVVTLGVTGQGFVVLRSDDDRDSLELRFAHDDPRSTQLLLPLSPDGSVTAAAQGPGSTHFVLDVSGYFVPAR